MCLTSRLCFKFLQGRGPMFPAGCPFTRRQFINPEYVLRSLSQQPGRGPQNLMGRPVRPPMLSLPQSAATAALPQTPPRLQTWVPFAPHTLQVPRMEGQPVQHLWGPLGQPGACWAPAMVDICQMNDGIPLTLPIGEFKQCAFLEHAQRTYLVEHGFFSVWNILGRVLNKWPNNGRLNPPWLWQKSLESTSQRRGPGPSGCSVQVGVRPLESGRGLLRPPGGALGEPETD